MEVIWLSDVSPGWTEDSLKAHIRLWWSLLVHSFSTERDQAAPQEFSVCNECKSRQRYRSF